jgi:hypothetical protein
MTSRGRKELIDCVSLDEDDVIKWVAMNKEPDEVFDKATLSYWAERNGYVIKGDSYE